MTNPPLWFRLLMKVVETLTARHNLRALVRTQVTPGGPVIALMIAPPEALKEQCSSHSLGVY